MLGVFVAGIHPSRTCMSGSLESVRWNACVHRLDLGLYSHPSEPMLTPREKSPILEKFSPEKDRTHDSASSSTLSPTLLLTYLCPSLPVEHWPSTTPRHRTLFWAALVIPDQLVPCCFSSASVSRLQLLRGRPLFLFPCGFQVRAWCVVLDAGFLRVCPIQPHFLRSICLATGSCPVRSHSSSFWIFTLYQRDIPDPLQSQCKHSMSSQFRY